MPARIRTCQLTPPPPLERLTTSQAAAALQLSESTFQRRRREGAIHAIKDGRKTYFAMDEIRRYAAQGE